MIMPNLSEHKRTEREIAGSATNVEDTALSSLSRHSLPLPLTHTHTLVSFVIGLV